MLDVRRLGVLREVARHGSFSAAAEALSFTQSAVSQQIAALEREAGTRLVERGSRGISLTESGRVLVGHADVILARLADAEQELSEIAGLRSGRVRMAALPSGCARLMPTAMARFRERFPGVELSLMPLEAVDAVDALKAGDCDIAVTIDGAAAESDPVDQVLLLEDPMYVVLPADHPSASDAEVNLADLADESWLAGTTKVCPDARIFDTACHAAGFEPRVAFRLDDYNAMLGFVATGTAVAVVPELALPSGRDDVAVRSLTGAALARRIVAATLRDSFPAPARQAMIEVLIEVGAETVAAREERGVPVSG